jgi:seryl-tRNA synthetase
MLDLKAIRHDASAVVASLAKRGLTFDLARFESLDARRKAADVRAQSLLAERKSASKKIGVLVAEGQTVDAAKSEVNDILSRLADELASATAEADAAQADLDALLQETPNLPDDCVPEGASEEQNKEIVRWGTPHEFAFSPRDHVDLGEALGVDGFGSRRADRRIALLSSFGRSRATASRFDSVHARLSYSEPWLYGALCSLYR